MERANPGCDIGDTVTAAIVTSDWFLSAVSPQALASDWVLREVRLARETQVRVGKPAIIPVLIKSCTLPDELGQLAHADFRFEYQDGLDGLLRTIGSPYRRALLEALLSESDGAIRSAWASMSQDQHTWCLSELEGFLTSAASPESAAAVTALALVGPDLLRLHLGRLLVVKSASVVRRALVAVGTLRERTLQPVVSGLVSHGNPEIRQAARAALRRLH